MFASLKTTTDSADFEIEDLYAELIEDGMECAQIQAELTELLNTFSELDHLRETIEQTGITKSLLMFADNNGVLSSNIKGIPSLESFTGDISVEDSQIALEDLGEKIKSVLAKIRQKLSDWRARRAVTWKQRSKVVVKAEEELSRLSKSISNKTFSEEKASSITMKLFPVDVIMKSLELSLKAHSVFKEMFTWDLPKTREEMVTFNNKFNEFVTTHRSSYRIWGYEGSQVKTPLKKMSLSEGKYTAESFSEIAEKLKEYYTSFESQERSFEGDCDHLSEKIQQILENRTFLEKLADVGGGVLGTVAGAATGNIVIAEAVAKIIPSVSGRLMQAYFKIANIAFDSIWYAYLSGPVSGIKMLRAVTKAYE